MMPIPLAVPLAMLALVASQEPAAPAPLPPKPILIQAAEGACAKLPRPRAGPPPFAAGEVLHYDIDVMGVRAGKMTFEVLATTGRGATAEIPVRVRAESNTFFSKVRRIKGEITTFLRPSDLHPRHFQEDVMEGGVTRHIDVAFPSGQEKTVSIDWSSTVGRGQSRNGFANDALDYVGGIFLFRALSLHVGQPFCFDVYALRRIWRVEGKVEAREHLATPAGEMDALHLAGTATRIAPGTPLKRDVHIWISDDDRRLPVAALGMMDLGPVRATLSSAERGSARTVAANPRSLNW